MDQASYDRLVERLAAKQHLIDRHLQGEPGAAVLSVELVRELYAAVEQGVNAAELLRDIRRRAAEPCPQCTGTRIVSAPISKLREIATDVRWDFDGYSARKAYVMSMLCELAYLHASCFDVDGSDRYDFIASSVLDEILAGREGVASARQLFVDADLPFAVIERRFFVYLVTRWQNFAIVAVRGTAKANEWITNIRAKVLRRTVADYHPGFMREAWDGLAELKTKIDAPLNKVYFTGHSLGGAIAALLSQRVSRFTPYIFGAPRFANHYGMEGHASYAHVRRADLVPHLPWESLGYADASDKLIPVGGHEQLSGAQTLREWLPSGKRFAVQHSIEGYRRLLGYDIGEEFPDGAYLELRKEVIGCL